MGTSLESFVDTHLHVWDPALFDYAWLVDEPDLRRAFLPKDLDVDGLPLAQVVVVEADRAPHQAAAEVSWVHGLVTDSAPIHGVVAHASLERGRRCSPDLAGLAAAGFVVGVRRILQDESAGFCADPHFVAGVQLLAEHDLAFDVCARARQLTEVTQLVRRCPDVTFVLDHCGKPDIAHGGWEPWASDLARLASSPNVFCKLSGLSSESDDGTRDAPTLGRYLRYAVEVFGADRCMFGSDWPVASTTMSYRGWFEVVSAALEDLGTDEREQIWGRTARRVYRIGAPRTDAS